MYGEVSRAAANAPHVSMLAALVSRERFPAYKSFIGKDHATSAVKTPLL